MAINKLPKLYNTDFRLPNKKPVGDVEIDWGNPFSKNVRNVWGFNGPAKITDGNPTGKAIPFLYDMVSGNSGHTYINSGFDAPPLTASQGGTGLEYDGGASYGRSYLNNASSDLLSGNDGTLVFVGRIDTTSGTQMLLGQSNSGLSPIYLYGCGLCVVDGELIGFRSVNSTTQKVSMPISSGNAVIAVSFSGTTVSMSYNGKSVSGTCRASGQNYLFGFGLSATSPGISIARAMMDGVLNFAFLTYEPFAPSQLDKLTTNPYQILKPKSEPVYFTADGGGGPVTQFITVEPITSGEAFGTATLAAGLVTITAIGIASEEAVGDVNIAIGATLLTPESMTSQEALGEPNLLVGTAVVEPTSITTEEALGLVSLLSQSVVLVSSITSEEIIGNPELAYDQILSVVSVHTGETIGNAKVLGGTVGLALNTVYRDVMSDVYRITMRDGYDIRT